MDRRESAKFREWLRKYFSEGGEEYYRILGLFTDWMIYEEEKEMSWKKNE